MRHKTDADLAGSSCQDIRKKTCCIKDKSGLPRPVLFDQFHGKRRYLLNKWGEIRYCAYQDKNRFCRVSLLDLIDLFYGLLGKRICSKAIEGPGRKDNKSVLSDNHSGPVDAVC